MASKSTSQHFKHTVSLLAQRIKAGTNNAEILCSFERAVAAGDFLFYLKHAHAPFGLVISKRHIEIADKEQDVLNRAKRLCAKDCF